MSRQSSLLTSLSLLTVTMLSTVSALSAGNRAAVTNLNEGLSSAGGVILPISPELMVDGSKMVGSDGSDRRTSGMSAVSFLRADRSARTNSHGSFTNNNVNSFNNARFASSNGKINPGSSIVTRLVPQGAVLNGDLNSNNNQRRNNNNNNAQGQVVSSPSTQNLASNSFFVTIGPKNQNKFSTQKNILAYVTNKPKSISDGSVFIQQQRQQQQRPSDTFRSSVSPPQSIVTRSVVPSTTTQLGSNLVSVNTNRNVPTISRPNIHQVSANQFFLPNNERQLRDDSFIRQSSRQHDTVGTFGDGDGRGKAVLEGRHSAEEKRSCKAGFTVRKGLTKQNNDSSVYRVYFQEVLTNAGGWSADAQEFKAPCPGFYYFSFHAVSTLKEDFTIALMKEGVYQVTAYGNKDGYQWGSNSALVQLNTNERVYLELQQGDIYEHPYDESYVTFTGFLVNSLS